MKLKKLTTNQMNDINTKSTKTVLNSVSRKHRVLYYLRNTLGILLFIFFSFASLSFLQFVFRQPTGFVEIFFISVFFILLPAFLFLIMRYSDFIDPVDNEILKKENEFFLLEHEEQIQNISSPMKTWLALFYNRERENKNFPYHNEKFKQFYCEIKEDINQQDANGDTLLHYILEHEPHSPFVAQALLMNADIHIQNNQGISPYDLILLHTPEYIVCLEKLNISTKITQQTGYTKPVSRL